MYNHRSKPTLFLCLIALAALCGCSDKKKTPIAIITPATHPSLEQIEKGFKETLEASNPGQFQFVTYNAQGNKTLMRAEVEEIAQKKPALVFTIGTASSQMTAEVLAKKRLEIPVVFAAVNPPVGISLAQSQKQVTGVIEQPDLEKEIELMLSYKPSIHKVLLVFNPIEPGLVKDVEVLSTILQEKSIELVTIEVFKTNEFMAKVTPFINDADIVLVLKDNTVVGGLDILAKLCNQCHIPLMASDLDSPDRGAALGYGVYEIEFGMEGGKKALQILRDHKAPNTIPVTALTHFTHKVNRSAAIAQGLELP